MQETKPDDARGIHRKYDIKRTDGSSEPGGKHAECSYFVLDLVHDPFAAPALRAYAAACRGTHPDLSRDLENILSTWPCGCRSVGECFHYGPATPSEAAAEIMSRNGADET